MKTFWFSASAVVVIAGTAFGQGKVPTSFEDPYLSAAPGFTNPTEGDDRTGAAVIAVPVGGTPSFDGIGAAGNTVMFINVGSGASGQSVNGIGWDVNLFADVNVGTFGGSWLSEIAVLITDSSGSGGIVLRPGIGNNFSGTQAFSSMGVIKLGGANPPPIVPLADGLIRLEFYETFNDQAGVADGAWLSGALFFQLKVPTPGSAGLLGLAGVGLLGRRRR